MGVSWLFSSGFCCRTISWAHMHKRLSWNPSWHASVLAGRGYNCFHIFASYYATFSRFRLQQWRLLRTLLGKSLSNDEKLVWRLTAYLMTALSSISWNRKELNMDKVQGQVFLVLHVWASDILVSLICRRFRGLFRCKLTERSIVYS